MLKHVVETHVVQDVSVIVQVDVEMNVIGVAKLVAMNHVKLGVVKNAVDHVKEAVYHVVPMFVSIHAMVDVIMDALVIVL